MEKNEIQVEALMERARAVSYLQDLVNSLKSGEIGIQHGEQALSFSPEASVKVSVKGKKKEGKESLSFKLSWTRTPPLEETGADLKIGGGAAQDA